MRPASVRQLVEALLVGVRPRRRNRRSSAPAPWRPGPPAPRAVEAIVTSPAPARSAPRALSTAAPVFPGDPATTSSVPARALVARGPLRAQPRRRSARRPGSGTAAPRRAATRASASTETPRSTTASSPTGRLGIEHQPQLERAHGGGELRVHGDAADAARCRRPDPRGCPPPPAGPRGVHGGDGRRRRARDVVPQAGAEDGVDDHLRARQPPPPAAADPRRRRASSIDHARAALGRLQVDARRRRSPWRAARPAARGPRRPGWPGGGR